TGHTLELSRICQNGIKKRCQLTKSFRSVTQYARIKKSLHKEHTFLVQGIRICCTRNHDLLYNKFHPSGTPINRTLQRVDFKDKLLTYPFSVFFAIALEIYSQIR